MEQSQISLSVNSVSCAPTLTTAHSVVTCEVPAGVGSGLEIDISVAGSVMVRRNIFAYEGMKKEKKKTKGKKKGRKKRSLKYPHIPSSPAKYLRE